MDVAVAGPNPDLSSSRRKSDAVEVKAFDCPGLLKKDITELFPDRDLKTGNLTIITYTMKTENDMGFWNEEMNEERTELTKKFIESASAICKELQKHGHWADLIDPQSGRPYFGSYTNATLFETNDHYKSLGLKIKDIGCCQVIEHDEWGRMAFVGTIITDAKVDSVAIKKIINGPELG